MGELLRAMKRCCKAPCQPQEFPASRQRRAQSWRGFCLVSNRTSSQAGQSAMVASVWLSMRAMDAAIWVCVSTMRLSRLSEAGFVSPPGSCGECPIAASASMSSLTAVAWLISPASTRAQTSRICARYVALAMRAEKTERRRMSAAIVPRISSLPSVVGRRSFTRCISSGFIFFSRLRLLFPFAP